MRILNSKSFLVGAIYLILLLAFSFLYDHLHWSYVHKETVFIYDKEGQVVGAPPFSPIQKPPLGTDRLGKDMLTKVIIGAKYTIVIIITISLIRVVLAVFIGICVSLSKLWIQKIFGYLVRPFQYIPTVIMTYIMLAPLLLGGLNKHMTMSEIIIYEIFVAIIFIVPTLSHFISDEIELIRTEEYVVCARVLGGGDLYIFKKHIWPHLKSKLLIIFMEQCIQVLILLTHLGFLELFFDRNNLQNMNSNQTVATSSNEWAGLIGANYSEVLTAPWIVLVPLTFISITILFINIMIRGIIKKS